MKWCNKCGEAKFAIFGGDTDECNCTEFYIIDEEGDEYKLYAYDERDAAMKYAEKSNTDGDYYLMNNPVEIIVNGRPFRISAEPDINYSATAL